MELCKQFNERSDDGRDMGELSELLSDAINSIIDIKEETAFQSEDFLWMRCMKTLSDR